LARPDADEIQLDVFGDCMSGVALYPEAVFRKYKPPFPGGGVRTIRCFYRLARRHSDATCPTQTCASLMPAIALETRCDPIAAAIGEFVDHSEVS
jgi:hypothetical protein